MPWGVTILATFSAVVNTIILSNQLFDFWLFKLLGV